MALAIISMAIGFVGCKKEKEKEKENNTVSINYEGIGKLHNLMCEEIVNKKGLRDEDNNTSTADVLEWIKICETVAKQNTTEDSDSIHNQANDIATFFTSIGNDEYGCNRLFSELIYSENEIRKMLQESGCTKELEESIILLYNNCFEEDDAKKATSTLRKQIEEQPDSPQKYVFLDVYSNSKTFWESQQKSNSKEAHIPFGLDCDEWCMVTDAIGGTAGIWGGVIGGAIMGAIFSVGTHKACKKMGLIPNNQTNS